MSFSTLMERLKTVDTKMIASEIYDQLCVTYFFPNIVSNVKAVPEVWFMVFMTNTHSEFKTNIKKKYFFHDIIIWTP